MRNQIAANVYVAPNMRGKAKVREQRLFKATIPNVNGVFRVASGELPLRETVPEDSPALLGCSVNEKFDKNESSSLY